MSYSFTVRAATKEDAKAQASAKYAEVLQAQPSHATDMAAAEAAAFTVIDLLPAAADRDVVVNCSGSVGWRGVWGADHEVTGLAISVGAHLVNREPAA